MEKGHFVGAREWSKLESLAHEYLPNEIFLISKLNVTTDIQLSGIFDFIFSLKIEFFPTRFECIFIQTSKVHVFPTVAQLAVKVMKITV